VPTAELMLPSSSKNWMKTETGATAESAVSVREPRKEIKQWRNQSKFGLMRSR